MVKIIQDNDFNDKKLTSIKSITIKRNPSSDNEVANKKYIDDSIGEDEIVRFTPTLQTNLKVSVGNDRYNLTKYDKISLIDVTEIRSPNVGYDLLTKWRIKIIHEKNGNKAGEILKPTVTSSSTSDLGATSLPRIGIVFM